jgi:hypothetical protein
MSQSVWLLSSARSVRARSNEQPDGATSGVTPRVLPSSTPSTACRHRKLKAMSDGTSWDEWRDHRTGCDRAAPLVMLSSTGLDLYELDRRLLLSRAGAGAGQGRMEPFLGGSVPAGGRRPALPGSRGATASTQSRRPSPAVRRRRGRHFRRRRRVDATGRGASLLSPLRGPTSPTVPLNTPGKERRAGPTAAWLTALER